MPTLTLRREEKELTRICEAVGQLQQGRSNAHGSFTLNGDGSATSTTVSAKTCAVGCHVNYTPNTAHAAAACQDGDFYIVAGNESFVVHHAATSETDCDFTFSING